MKKILVLGAGGMAGHVVATYLKELSNSVTTVSAHNKLDKNTELIDVTKIEDLKAFLDSNRFDVVVNCIGLLVQASEEKKDLAVYLNSYLPHYLESFYKETKTKLIHLSTDCVFSGKNPPYYENSWPDGELFYDRSKALGEVVNGKDLTFRMSIIGPDMQEKGAGLFNWFYAQSGEIYGFTKAIWTGVTTIELAKAIDMAVSQNLTGLYHLVPNSNISKFSLLQLFKNEFDRDDIIIHPKETELVDKTLINTRTDFDYSIPNYETMVAEMHIWIKKHKELYPHYKLS